MAQKPKVTYRVSKFDKEGRMVGRPERFVSQWSAQKRAAALRRLRYHVEVDEIEIVKVPRGWH